MTIVDGKRITYKGDQFPQFIGGVDYSLQQIVMALYNEMGDQPLKYWVKVADSAKYPGADLIIESGQQDYPLKIFITNELTNSLIPGVYWLEIEGTVGGEQNPIETVKVEFFTLKSSIIP